MTRPRPLSHDYKRADLVRETATALSAAGVAHLALRDLANRLGTSDRMLLYYFENKDELMLLALQEIAARFAVRFFDAVPRQGRQTPRALLHECSAALLSPAVAPFLQVWTDADSRGCRGEEPYITLVMNTANWWLGWLEDKIDMPRGAERRDTATAILTLLEGVKTVETSIPGAAATAVRLFGAALP